MCRNSKRENREIQSVSGRSQRRQASGLWDRSENAPGDHAEMNADRKSDGFVVPAEPANKDATEASAESAEKRPGGRPAPDPEPE
jgi:hypothetical protein